MTKKTKEQEPWGAVAFVFSFLVILFIFVFTIGQGPRDEDGSGGEQASAQAQKAGPMTEDDFWQLIAEHQPTFEGAETDCLVDQTQFDLPITPQGKDNRAGGVATDLMKIAIRPDKESKIKPNFDLQEFEQKLGTCPSCGATYMDIDYYNAQSSLLEAGVENLGSWDLAAFLPTLDPQENEGWTSDVKAFVRYKTQQQAGFPSNELGFGALAGAYCSNFSSWFGKDYTVPSPAFYALAAAQIKSDLDLGLPEAISGRSISAMVLGELYRLLGRSEDASHWYSYARGLGALDPNFLMVLEFSEGNLASGDYSLKRVPDVEGGQVPPIGWQIDNMLPNINGHISEHRDDWAGLDGIDEIEAKIISIISAGAG